MSKNEFKKTIGQYCENNQGQIGVWFALLALPILVMTTFVIDLAGAEKERVQLSAALDDAALAAVARQNITESERKAYATEYFWQNIENRKDIKFEVIDASDNRVELGGETRVPTTISAAIGVEEIEIQQSSAAELTKGDVICFLVLDPDGARSLVLTGGGQLQSENCSVQVNSTDENAAVVDHGAVAMAKDFCVSGGVNDATKFKPHVNTECAKVADPYENLIAPPAGDCIDRQKLDEILDHYTASFSPGVNLEPGTYCGGLQLNSKVVNFLPGTYVIKDGPLILENFTRATANDVTFVLSGKEAFINLGDASAIDIKAPSTGPLAGLAFFQDLQDRKNKLRNLPDAETYILDASGLSIVGTAYLPTQKIIFEGGALSDSAAPATSFIAYNVEIRGGSVISVNVDHVAGKIPPILPRSDEGTRLTR